MPLEDKKCVPCEVGGNPLPKTEAERFLKELKTSWETDSKKIWHQYVFKNFVEAIQFVNGVAKLAENEGHHPDITINYNKVMIELTTHAVKGLSENDFILARKIEILAETNH